MPRRPILTILWHWLPAAGIMAIIFAASATPSTQMPDFGTVDLLVKKAGHFLVYAALVLACLRGLNNPKPAGRLTALALCVLYAISDEVHQSTVPGRNAAWYDLVIDAGGALAGLWLWSRWRLLQRLTVPSLSRDTHETVTVPKTFG